MCDRLDAKYPLFIMAINVAIIMQNQFNYVGDHLHSHIFRTGVYHIRPCAFKSFGGLGATVMEYAY